MRPSVLRRRVEELLKSPNRALGSHRDTVCRSQLLSGSDLFYGLRATASSASSTSSRMPFQNG